MIYFYIVVYVDLVFFMDYSCEFCGVFEENILDVDFVFVIMGKGCVYFERGIEFFCIFFLFILVEEVIFWCVVVI